MNIKIKIFRYIQIFLFLIVTTACLHNNGSDLLEETNTYFINLAKWQNANLSDYQFTYNRYCFCPPQGDIVIEVQNDDVVSAFYFDSGEYLTNEQLADMPTIDDLFAIIESAINRQAYKITANYNDVYGYPAYVSIDYDQNAVDEEFGFTVENFM